MNINTISIQSNQPKMKCDKMNLFQIETQPYQKTVDWSDAIEI